MGIAPFWANLGRTHPLNPQVFPLWSIHLCGIIGIATEIILTGWDLGICVIYVDVHVRPVSDDSTFNQGDGSTEKKAGFNYGPAFF